TPEPNARKVPISQPLPDFVWRYSMPDYKYLIIGGGMTADAAVHGIREVDSEGAIGIISAEPDAPYDRPPLTKSLWKGKDFETVWRHTETQRVQMRLGVK